MKPPTNYEQADSLDVKATVTIIGALLSLICSMPFMVWCIVLMFSADPRSWLAWLAALGFVGLGDSLHRMSLEYQKNARELRCKGND